jgi:hypothetical protein
VIFTHSTSLNRLEPLVTEKFHISLAFFGPLFNMRKQDLSLFAPEGRFKELSDLRNKLLAFSPVVTVNCCFFEELVDQTQSLVDRN